jgi:hypothetical protein
MLLRRWQLLAEPGPLPDSDDPYYQAIRWETVRMAQIFNEEPERFFTRRAAVRAGRFYTEHLDLPLVFTPEFLHAPVTCTQGQVTARSQGKWGKRGSTAGQFMDAKRSPGAFKGVRREN